MKIKNTKDLENHFIKAVIYGESGAGKTTLASTLKGKTLVISAEKGLLSISGADIDYVDLSEGDDGSHIERPLDRLLRLRDALDMLKTEKPKYQNVFLDSITEVSQVVVADLYDQFPDAKDGLKLWGENAKRMRAIAKSFRDLPNYHVFMTCVAQPDKDENNKRFMGFMMQGKISDELPQYFDEVFYLKVADDGKRSLITKKTAALICKDRSNRLHAEELADLEHIKGKILGLEEKKK